jgi:hypothetical protein
MQLDHAGGRAEDDPGLPLVGGDHDDRCALGAEHEVVQAERGHQRGPSLPTRQHPACEGRGRVRVEHRSDQLDLPVAQAQRF